MKAKRRADADRRAVDRGDQRLVELGEPGDERPAGEIGEMAARPAPPAAIDEEIADVVAGGEDAAAAAR